MQLAVVETLAMSPDGSQVLSGDSGGNYTWWG